MSSGELLAYTRDEYIPSANTIELEGNVEEAYAVPAVVGKRKGSASLDYPQQSNPTKSPSLHEKKSL